MKTGLTIWCVCGLLLLSAIGVLRAQNSVGESKSCDLVIEALNAASRLKIGMLRADLSKDFEPDGGLSVQDHGTFTYRRCHYIKIDIEFKLRDASQNANVNSPEDELTKISRPYLAYPVSD